MSYAWADIVPRVWDRFLSYVEVQPCGCWVWRGARSRGKGNKAWYSSFRVGRWVVRGHIFVCVAEGRMIPGHHVDHRCRNTLCVNPSHLEVVTPLVNQARKMEARALSC